MQRSLFTTAIVILCISFLAIAGPAPVQGRTSKKDSFVIVTFASDNLQERSARALIRSIRERAGDYRDARIYVVLGDPENFPCGSLKGKRVELVPLAVDEGLLEHPLAIKAFAAAAVERLVDDKVTTLAWFDPASLVLGPLDELDLEGRYDVAIRPVSLLNTIGMAPGSEPDEYWGPVYEYFHLDPASIPTCETIVDEKPIQAYFNCEIFSVDPALGIFSLWEEALTERLRDEEYLENVCNTFLRQLFLHQAVLSGAIVSKVDEESIKPLSIKTGYPFGQHGQLSDGKKAESLNGLSAVIMDYRWDRDPGWMGRIPVEGELKDWLTSTFIEYMKLTDNLYRMEGSCNSYLVTTGDGSVLIDPAGASGAPEYFKSIIEEHPPLKAILLTHAHKDHWDNMSVWTDGLDVPIIAQREFIKYNEYWGRLAPFFARRGAIWGGRDIPAQGEADSFEPVVPTVTFVDEYTLESGGVHFRMVHTPGETPDHTTIWIPELGAVFVGDNYYKWFINNATPRGTLTRPVLGYIAALDLALSYEPEFFLMGHGTAVTSKGVVNETVTTFRDAIKYIHDETIKGINEGKDVHTIMREIEVPEQYGLRPIFGKVAWTVRGIYHENVGWFDENPASMYGEPASSIYPELVGIMGPDAILDKAESLSEEGEYVKVLHLTDVVLGADSSHKRGNQVRLAALRAIKAAGYHYIEHIWLDYGIKLCEENLGPAED